MHEQAGWVGGLDVLDVETAGFGVYSLDPKKRTVADYREICTCGKWSLAHSKFAWSALRWLQPGFFWFAPIEIVDPVLVALCLKQFRHRFARHGRLHRGSRLRRRW